jgi:D-hydroxyproline dehydrogenase subunit beta
MHAGHYDLAIVGAGICGLAHALAAARRGKKVVVIDRDARANGASVRNFGYVTVSGQERGGMWQRARRSREVWREVAAAAGIAILQTGVWMTARRPESVRVMEAFMATEMAGGCRLLDPAEARRRCPQLRAPQLAAVLESSTELRVESREAIPRLAAWLAEMHCVAFQRETTVRGIEMPHVHTSRGRLQADYVAVCPGDDFNGLYPERLGSYALTRCKLQMLRLADPGFRLPGAFMSDLGLCRYRGFSQLPAARALEARLIEEQPRHFEHGVHLIVVQSADGSLVVGDSHHYAVTPDPFSQQSVDALILEEFNAALGFAPPPTLERWTGTYASASDRAVVIDAPEARVRIATVTCGAGASIGFALGEELINSLLNSREAA